MPFGKGRKFLGNAGGLTNAIAGGWQISSIVTAQSGAPFSVSLSTPTANTGTFTRPNRICNGNLPSSKQTINAFFDTSCFVAPRSLHVRQRGTQHFDRSGTRDMGPGADKDFALTERFGLQFRSEFFNVLNRANFGLPNGSIGSAAQGYHHLGHHQRQADSICAAAALVGSFN